MLSRRKNRALGESAESNSAASAPLEERSGETLNPRARLGEMLVQEGVISDGQLEEALAYQQENGGFLGNALVSLQYIDQDTLVSFLVKQCKIPHISLLDYGVNEDLFNLVPKELCLKHFCIPIDRLGKILTVAMVNPFDIEALDSIRSSCPDLKIKPILCDYNHFDQIAHKHLNAPAAPQAPGADVSAQSFGLTPAAPKPAKQGLTSEKKRETKVPPKKPQGRVRSAGAAAMPAIDSDELSARIESALAAGLNAALSPLVDTIESMQRRLEFELGGTDSTANVEAFPRAVDGAKARTTDEVLEVSGVSPNENERLRHALSEMPSNDAYTFEGFFAGAANAMTETLARGLAGSNDDALTPFYICGGVGLGKTHLLHAIGNVYCETNPDIRVRRMTAGQFARGCEPIGASGSVRAFLETFSGVDVFLLDDVHLLGGNADAQTTFIEVFDALCEARRPVVVTGLAEGDQGRALDPQLASRLGGAVVAGLKPPTFETRVEILRHCAGAAAVDLPDDVTVLIAQHISDDVRRLKGAFEKVSAFMRVANGGITADEARELIVQFDRGAVA